MIQVSESGLVPWFCGVFRVAVGVRMLSVRGNRAVGSRQRLTAEKPQQLLVVETLIAITRFQTVVSWHSSSLKDQVQTIELSVAHWQAGMLSPLLRLRVRWLSHLPPILTQSFLPRVPPFQI